MESFGYMKWGDGPGGHWKSRAFFLALAVLAGTVLWALILSVFLSHASTQREELFHELEELSANASKHGVALGTLKKDVGTCQSCCETVQGQLQSALRELAATQTKLLQQENSLKELTTSVTQDAAKANRDREDIRNELYRALQNVQSQNGSCEPCPESWRVFEGSCYFFSEKKASWQEAQQQCALASAHLVVIGSLEEQGFLNRNIQRDHGYWLGLRAVRRLGRVERYQWVDGLTMGFSYWNTGEPNDSRREEDCVMMLDSGLWNDAPCRNERDHWICEKRRSSC
ncbi:C-type lectin domain family 4 member G [Ochotona princeps]|uniref:C-type lectin domain family 4 member G n=1 Tax=Ochotona princeps TaxID=9978 RepID=UPI002714FD62|nr:C-type lectin domain family 4 member G [Ochotona princeps]